MRIDAKGVQVFLWKTIGFSMNSFWKCVQKHPVVAGVLLVFFLVYLLLPSVFFILIFASSVLLGAAVFIRFRFNSKRQNVAEVWKKDSEKLSGDSLNDGVKRSTNPSFRSQKSVRRNVRKGNIGCDAHGNIITLINPLDEILGRNTWSKVKHTIVRKREGKTSSTFDDGETSSNNATKNIEAGDGRCLLFDSERSTSDPIWHEGFDKQCEKFSGDGEAEVESMEEAEEDDEEEVQEDGNKVLEWTEDDQKNLMDLGNSELERNRRLESLIARRRGRKLFKMAIENSVMNMDSAPPGPYAPIFVARNNQFDDLKNFDQEGLLIPDSAPSILLPGRNPFDLPYDAHEEKPNLTGDSFQQEFMAVPQKDIMFCRHESFCRGPFFPFKPKHDLQDPQFDLCFGTKERPRYSTFGMQSEDNGVNNHHKSSIMGSATNLVQLESLDPNQVINSESEELHPDELRMKEGNLIEIDGERREDPNGLQLSLVNELEVQTETDSIKDNQSSSSSSSEASEMILNRIKFPQVLSDHAQRSLVQAAPLKSPLKSTSLDRPPFDYSPTAIDKPRFDNRSFFNVPCHTPTYSIASDLQVEVSEVGSPRLMPLVDGAASFVDEDTITYDADVDKDITPESEEKWGGSFYQEGRDGKGSKSRELHETREEHTFNGHSDLNKKPEDSIVLPTVSENSLISFSPKTETIENGQSYPTDINHHNTEGVEPTVTEVEVSRMSNVSNESSPRSLKNRIREDFTVHSSSQANFERPEQNDGSNSPLQLLTLKQELPKPLARFEEEASNIHNVEPVVHANAAEVISSVSSEYNPVNSEWCYDQGIMAYEKTMEDNRNFEYIRDREGDHEELTKHNVGNEPEAVLKSIQDDRDEQNVPENNVPLAEQRFDDPSASSLHQRIGVEQDSITSGSCPSPRSVLLQQIPTDQNPQYSLENFVDHSPSNSSFRNMEGQSDTMVNSTEESDTINQINELNFDHMEGKKDSLIKSTEGKLKTTLISHWDAEDVSKPDKESNPSFGKLIEVTHANLIEHEASISHGKSQHENAHSNVPEATAKEEKFAPEVDNINNINESVANQITDNGKSNHVDIQCETQMSDRGESLVQPSNNSEATNAIYIEGTEYKYQRLSEEEGSAGPITKPAGESDTSSVINIEELRELISQESAKATPKPDENGLKCIENSKDRPQGLPEGDESSKPTEAEAKAVNTETKDGHIVDGHIVAE
ncbi:hypothetical protein SLEP1_g35515 [Rubroshorea leprosula]|uniref:Uncharacterized protein n=1 Tax=Rubroshorea leprosula TaxID=152421 RepID=A0AAV5KNI4_9ROSI|nr:hypothetical protein SLEP1_g35515 [Rubroshorea leprosula]